jgi:DNA-binding response OmpR family regulator
VPDESSPHVVVLDGSPIYAVVYGNLFAAEGYRVSTLTDCAVAPAEVLAMLPDLVVLDLQCGGGWCGLDFLRRLRVDPVGQVVPVIASTPASSIGMAPLVIEVRSLDAAIFDGITQYDDMITAARTATAQARILRRQSGTARDRLRTVVERQ